jgi:predicted tellurium resistance membrane protein TerC
MKQTSKHVVTSLGEAPDEERKRRIIIYTVSMTIRFICVIALVFTTGIWQWIAGIGAIFLPYFAVVVANTVGGEAKSHDAPKKVEPLSIDLGEHLKAKDD